LEFNIKKKIVILANSAWYIYNFRLNKMRALKMKGHELIVIAPCESKYTKMLINEGYELRLWNIQRTSVNPIYELISIISLFKLLKSIKPDFIFTYTPKGNIYCNIVGLILKLDIINNISGMGEISTKVKIIQYSVRLMYKLTLRKTNIVLFQNINDMNYFLNSGLLKDKRYSLLPGSGVDTLKFIPKTNNNLNLKVLFMGRLLIEKGLIDLIDAIKIIRQKYPSIEFYVLGMFEPPRSSAIKSSDIDAWEKDGLIRYLGQTDDVQNVLSTMDCFMFPSYYGEGIPRSILEASSCGLPVITTNHPGCRDAIIDGVSGLLCEPKNPVDLSRKIVQFINMPRMEKQMMGLEGRKLMVEKFDESIVINKYIEIIESKNIDAKC
jgi:glycosyltransferase involved in cell wall biosynthesis